MQIYYNFHINICTVKFNPLENRFLPETTGFEITNIPREIRLEDTLSISGNGPPLTTIILSINNEQNIEFEEAKKQVKKIASLRLEQLKKELD